MVRTKHKHFRNTRRINQRIQTNSPTKHSNIGPRVVRSVGSVFVQSTWCCLGSQSLVAIIMSGVKRKDHFMAYMITHCNFQHRLWPE